MKVGIVCPYSLSWPGGVQGHVLSLSSHLQDLGCETRVVAPCDATPPAPEVISIGGSRPFDANGSIARLALGPGPFVRVGRTLAAEKFDLIHIHEPFQASASIFALIQAGRTPVVATFHAAAEELDHYKRFRAILMPLWRKIDLRAAVSPAAAELARKYFGGEYRILPNGVELERFAECEPSQREPSDFVVLFVGRLEPRKGCEVLLRSWAAIESSVSNARLWIVGTGPQESELREFASNARLRKVEFLGSVGTSELRRRFKGADVFCSPAVGGESFGIVLLEAMAAGTPVIASDLPGYSSVVAGGAGILFPPGDADSLTRAVVSLSGDHESSAALAANGKKRAAEFDWVRLANNVLAVYEETLTMGETTSAA